jgi:hypothetical protein
MIDYTEVPGYKGPYTYPDRQCVQCKKYRGCHAKTPNSSCNYAAYGCRLYEY